MVVKRALAKVKVKGSRLSQRSCDSCLVFIFCNGRNCSFANLFTFEFDRKSLTEGAKSKKNIPAPERHGMEDLWSIMDSKILFLLTYLFTFCCLVSAFLTIVIQKIRLLKQFRIFYEKALTCFSKHLQGDLASLRRSACQERPRQPRKLEEESTDHSRSYTLSISMLGDKSYTFRLEQVIKVQNNEQYIREFWNSYFTT